MRSSSARARPGCRCSSCRPATSTSATRRRGSPREHGYAYALGIHPLWLAQAQPSDIDRLRDMVPSAMEDPRFVAIGEIGIDLFEPGLDPGRQQWFYREQLKVARDFGLPVIVHIRRSADLLLKHLRAIEVPGGIIHAFNASEQQAQQFIARGFRLGFGGAMTYDGSQRIRRHARALPEDRWVLETDAPYIPPQWLRKDGEAGRNEPSQLPRIAEEMAALRGSRARRARRAEPGQCRRRAAAPRCLAERVEPLTRAVPCGLPRRSPSSPAFACCKCKRCCPGSARSPCWRWRQRPACSPSSCDAVTFLRVWRRVVACAAAAVAGFAYAAAMAAVRIADELPFADEGVGRPGRGRGVVAAGPARARRALRIRRRGGTESGHPRAAPPSARLV